jgi:hypothetical protein
MTRKSIGELRNQTQTRKPAGGKKKKGNQQGTITVSLFLAK